MQRDDLARGEVSTRPTVAVVGFGAAVVDDLKAVAASVTAFADEEAFAASLDRFDVVVVSGSIENSDDDSYVLIVGDAVHDGRNGVGRVSSLAQVETRRLTPAEDVPEAFATAANGLCAGITGETQWFSGLTFGDRAVARPLVVNGDTVIAALYDRGRGVGLAVPAAADVVEWFRAFLEHVHELDAEAVPESPPRVARPRDWRTAHEVEAVAQLERIDEEIAELIRWRAEAIASLTSAGRDAEIGERWMLWASGDDLVGSVRMALEDLGLEVTEVDRDGREHLHVRSADLPDWVALVDVASFDGAPTLQDLRSVNQHRMTYIAENATQPAQVWWVVNDHCGLDPSRRPRALDGLEEGATLVDVVAFSTRDLFLLGRDVGLEKLESDTARKMLTEAAPGVLRYPSADEDPEGE